MSDTVGALSTPGASLAWLAVSSGNAGQPRLGTEPRIAALALTCAGRAQVDPLEVLRSTAAPLDRTPRPPSFASVGNLVAQFIETGDRELCYTTAKATASELVAFSIQPGRSAAVVEFPDGAFGVVAQSMEEDSMAAVDGAELCRGALTAAGKFNVLLICRGRMTTKALPEQWDVLNRHDAGIVAPPLQALALLHDLAGARLALSGHHAAVSGIRSLHAAHASTSTVSTVADIMAVTGLTLGVATSQDVGFETALAWYQHYLRIRGLDMRLSIVQSPLVTTEAAAALVALLAGSSGGAPHGMIALRYTDGDSPGDLFGCVIDFADGEVCLATHGSGPMLQRARLQDLLPAIRSVVILSSALSALGYKMDAADVGQTFTVARYRLPPVDPLTQRFEFPRTVCSIAAVANAFNSVGVPITCEDFIGSAGCRAQELIGTSVPLFALEAVINHVCRHRLKNAAFARATALEGGRRPSAMEVAAIMRSSLTCDSSRRVLVTFDEASLRRHDDVWNGSSGGGIAMVVGFDVAAGTVMLEDANPEPFFRTWSCPLGLLMQLMSEVDPMSDCARGFIEFGRGANPSAATAMSALDCLTRPFKRRVSPIASAIALAVAHVTKSRSCEEDVIYACPHFPSDAFASGVSCDCAVSICEQFLNSSESRRLVRSEGLRRGDFSKMSATDFVALLSDRRGTVVLLYHVSMVFGDELTPFVSKERDGVAGGIIVRVDPRDTTRVYVGDGDPLRRGFVWSAPLERIQKAAAVCFVLARAV